MVDLTPGGPATGGGGPMFGPTGGLVLLAALAQGGQPLTEILA